jgi:Ca2+-transporting ATPase
MLTGDHPLTAHAIADELNLVHQHDFLFNGDQLSKMTKEERWRAYQQGAIFSRVLPEQKYEMVLALKEVGKVVAMTGDGINDAPALKIADIGISMGENATDVARSSAQMVLMKNDFQGIVEAVIEGRRIFSNLKRSFSFLISNHVPSVFFAFVPPLIGLGNLLMPIHIVLFELVVHPVSAFAFENLPAPQNASGRELMTKKNLLASFMSGVLLSMGSLFLYYRILDFSDSVTARSVAIASIMIGNIFFVLVESWPKITLRFVMISTCLIIFLLVILKIEYIARILYLTNISDLALLQAAGIGLLASVPTFILKIFFH